MPAPLSAEEITAARPARWREDYRRTGSLLQLRWPLVFACARALTVGVHHQLFAALGERWGG